MLKSISMRIKFIFVFIILFGIILYGITVFRTNIYSVAIQKGDFVETVFGLATIQSSEVYHLRVGLPSVIVKVFVEKGDNVERGSNLVLFDSFGILKSPIRGVITNLNYEEGELVNPQTSILTVMDLENKFLSVLLEERAAVKIKRGQPVRIRFEAWGEGTFLGKVKSVFPSDGQFEVRIELENFPIELLPGMTADVAIIVKSKNNVLKVPLNAIQKDSIEILKNGKNHKVKIELGLRNSEYIEIISDNLREGDLIVIPGVK